MMKMVVTEENAFIKQGPNKMDLPENFHNDLKNSLGIFTELGLLNNPKIKLVGKEIFEGNEVYAIEINGEMMSNKFLYDVSSGLKIKEISITNMGGQSQTQESIIRNYKDYNGILLPTERSQSMGPQSIEMKLVDVLFNEKFDEKDFN